MSDFANTAVNLAIAKHHLLTRPIALDHDECVNSRDHFFPHRGSPWTPNLVAPDPNDIHHALW
jgi:hypothetical protein